MLSITDTYILPAIVHTDLLPGSRFGLCSSMSFIWQFRNFDSNVSICSMSYTFYTIALPDEQLLRNIMIRETSSCSSWRWLSDHRPSEYRSTIWIVFVPIDCRQTGNRDRSDEYKVWQGCCRPFASSSCSASFVQVVYCCQFLQEHFP